MRQLLITLMLLTGCATTNSHSNACSVIPDFEISYDCRDHLFDVALRLDGRIPFMEGEEESIDNTVWCEENEIKELCTNVCATIPNWLPCTHQCTTL